MGRIILVLLFIAWEFTCASQPLPVKWHHKVIIDTDCAIDDMRAICMLLSRPEISIEAILLSDGSLPPAEGATRIASLLGAFHRDDIDVAAGEELKAVNPPWREFNRKISWTAEKKLMPVTRRAVDVLSEKLRNSNERIVLVCLGPLTNITRLTEGDKDLLSKIERIIWYNESVDPMQGFNYECDKAGADRVFDSGIRMDVISNLNKNKALFDTSLLAAGRESDTQFARIMGPVYAQPEVAERLKQGHFRLCDDLTVLYLTNPELFDINTLQKNVKTRYNRDFNVEGIREAISDMLRGSYVSEQHVVFNRFPANREMFNYDVRPIIDSAIARYGYDEWKANVMTDEFHGHLGVFSIVGAKMGIKARELFGVGPDILQVLTFAGSKPPYSCLNDGIQVSTGATLGMGTIHLAQDSITRPSAIFTYQGRSLCLTLKREYLDKVNSDIREGILKFGLMDDGYWKLVRRNALKYWLEWDRDVIFEVEEVEPVSGNR